MDILQVPPLTLGQVAAPLICYFTGSYIHETILSHSLRMFLHLALMRNLQP